MTDLPVRLPFQILLHPPSESYFTFYKVRVHNLPRSVDSHVCYLMAMTYLEMPGSALPPPFGFPYLTRASTGELHFVHRQLQFRLGCRVVDEQAATGSTGPHRRYARDVIGVVRRSVLVGS